MMKSKKALSAVLALALLLAGCTPVYHTLGEGQSADASAPPSLQGAATAAPEQAAPREAVSLEEAKSLALDHAQVDKEQAVFTKTQQEREDGREVYEIEFTVAKKGRYEYEVDAGTGEILKADWEAAPEAGTGGGITADEAKALALDHAQVDKEQAVFTKTQQEWEDGREVYEIEFTVAEKGRYEYEVDAGTGEILKADWEAAPEAGSGRAITADEAKALALEKVPGATLSDIWEFEEDRDHGQVKYEGEIFYGGVKYEFEIDGATGAFLSWEKEGAIRQD